MEGKFLTAGNLSLFDQLCPVYMSYGMSYDEYWNGDAEMVKPYREAFMLKQRRENTKAWIQGLYIYEAILDCTPPLIPFSKAKPLPYPTKPFPLTELERKELEEEKEKEQCEENKAKLMAFVERSNHARNTRQSTNTDNSGNK